MFDKHVLISAFLLLWIYFRELTTSLASILRSLAGTSVLLYYIPMEVVWFCGKWEIFYCKIKYKYCTWHRRRRLATAAHNISVYSVLFYPTRLHQHELNCFSKGFLCEEIISSQSKRTSQRKPWVCVWQRGRKCVVLDVWLWTHRQCAGMPLCQLEFTMWSLQQYEETLPVELKQLASGDALFSSTRRLQTTAICFQKIFCGFIFFF